MWNKIQRIYIGTNQVRPPYWDYTPTSNTLVYYRMKEDLNDYSWNNRNLTGTVTFADNKMTNTSTLSRTKILSGTTWAFTVSIWTRGWNTWGVSENDSWWAQWFLTAKWVNQDNYNWNAIINWSWRRSGGTTAIGTNDDFLLLTFVYNWNNRKAYNNGVNFGTTTNCSWNLKTTATSFRVGAWVWGQIIIEKWAWSVSDIQTYYNNSKWNYWL